MSLVPPSHNPADSYERIAHRISLRQDSAANWMKNDPVLESGEFGYEVGYPTGKLKIGTGSTRWSELPYLLSRGPSGQPGPAGPPGKGIQIKGVADVWPPAGTPEPGDLWILDDPIPPTAPAGSAPGDGYVWSGNRWTPTGPIRGPAGESVTVFEAATAPTANRIGDIWLETTAGGATLNVWDGAQWVAVSTASSHKHYVSDTAPTGTFEEGDLWIDPTGTGVASSAVYEQDSEPQDGKDGDLWLAAVPAAPATASDPASTGTSPPTENGPRITIEDVDREIELALSDPSSQVLKELKESIVAATLAKINGYTSRTPDFPWQDTVAVAGSGKVEACIRGGVLRLRGTVTLTTSKWTHVRSLPSGWPKPMSGSATVCVGAESGVAERLVIVFVGTDGKIEMSPMGNRVTDFRLDNVTCQMP